MSAHKGPLPLRYLSHILVLIAVGLLLLTVGAPRVYAAPLCVNPGGTGSCYPTIAAAIAAAAPGNPITVAAGTYYEHNITIDKALSITGTGPNSTIVDGQGLGRVFSITTPDSVSISGVTIRNGAVWGAGGGIYNGGNLTLNSSSVFSNTAFAGAGIANARSLTVTNTALINNVATLVGGGGIDNGTSNAHMNLYNVDIGYNRTSGPTLNGGGILMYDGSQATLRFVAIYANGSASATSETAHAGGGIYAGPGTTLTIDQSAIYSNTIAGGDGAGIYSEGTATLTNVTISANGGNGSNGGGIQNSGSGTVLIVNSTIVSNTLTGIVGSGGGINNSNPGSTSVQILNTILANNTTAEPLGPNCYGAVYSLGHNLENINSCGLAGTGDLPNTNPRLGPLLYNGGPTMTHALLLGSPAIDAGTNVGCPSADQRGIRRPLGARCDIGAYEAALLYLPLVTR